MEQFQYWWHYDLGAGNTVANLFGFGTTLFVGLAIAKVVNLLFHGRFREWANRTKTDFDDALLDALERPLNLFLIGVAARASIEFLVLPEVLERLSGNVLTVILTVFVAWGITRVQDAVRIVFIDPRVEASETKLDDQLVPIADRTLKVVIWSLAILIAFSNLGYDILSLLTGLGIGGLAVALAAQATLSNLLGAVTIFADQPFQVGDLITLQGHTGVVTDVGLRASRMQTFEGYTVTVPNAAVVGEPVINRTIAKRWRHDMKLGLVYQTTSEQLAEAMRILTEILTEHPHVEPGFAVRFMSFGDSALELTVAYFVTDRAVGRFLDTQSEVNLEIKRRFDAAGLSFAYPSVSVYMEK
ncbi:MAG: mechanosensitive ion channel family protein [Myxococcota bacterium]